MTKLTAPFFDELMESRDVSCFFCDMNGIISRCGRGITARFPRRFHKGVCLSEILPTPDSFSELLRDVRQQQFFISPPFQLEGSEYLLSCLFYRENASGREQIFCRLEFCGFQPLIFKRNFQCYNMIEMENTELLAKISRNCRGLRNLSEAEDIARLSEAVLRNNMLLSISRSILQSGSEEETVRFKSVLVYLQTQFNSILDREEQLSFRYDGLTEKTCYLDTARFFEAFLALITIHRLDCSLKDTNFLISEKNGNVFIRAMGDSCETELSSKQRNLISMLQNILLAFCHHYKGSSASMTYDGKRITSMNFHLSPSSDPITNENFRTDGIRGTIYPIQQLLAILEYADR